MATPSLTELTQCSICKQFLEDPRVLQCLHTMCFRCIRKACKPPSIECPMCKFPTQSYSIERLPKNMIAAEKVRVAKGIRSCVNCADTDASVYCRQCDAMLCETCNENIHSNHIFHNHTTTKVTSTVGGVSFCTKHTGVELTLFCGDCGFAVCKDCVNDSHRSHSTQPIENVSRRIAMSIGHTASAFLRASEVAADGIENVEAALQSLSQQRAKGLNDVNSAMDRLINEVNARRAQMVAQLNGIASDKSSLLNEQLATLRRVEDNMLHSRTVAISLQNPALPPLAVADIGASAETYVQFVESQRLDTVPCVDTTITVEFDDSLNVAEYGSIFARRVAERTFAFTAPFDHLGVLYFLGTHRGISLYSNPCSTGAVTVTSSSLAYGSVSNVVSATITDFCTQNVPNSWVVVELNAAVCVNYYSLAHDAYDTEAHFLRHWVLQGWSAQTEDWVNLRVHDNDETLHGGNLCGAWPVAGCDIQGHTKFRVLQTGANSNGNHYMMLSGLELYGVLLG